MNKEERKEYNKKYYQNNKEQIKEQRKEHYKANKEQIKEQMKEHYKANKEQIKEQMKEHYKANKDKIKEHYKANKDKIKEYCKANKDKIKEHYKSNKDKILEQQKKYQKARKKIDPIYKIRSYISTIIGQVLKRNSSSKKGISCMKYLPYTIADLKQHIEQQFEPWMNWNNHGVYNINTWNDNDQSTWTWQLDHIIPQSQLPYSSMEDDNFKKCWSLDNLRPLSAKQNLLDGDRT